MFSWSLSQLLKWKNLLVYCIKGNQFRVQDEIVNTLIFLCNLPYDIHDIRICHAHVFQISWIYVAIFTLARHISIIMNLSSESIIFIFTSKINAFKSFQNYWDSRCRFCKHRFYWNANSNFAVIFQFFIIITLLRI